MVKVPQLSRKNRIDAVVRDSNEFPTVRARVREFHRSRQNLDAGFTLIELIIVIAIIPLVVGAISVAMISVFTEQNSVASRISNSGDTSVLSANFVKDVQSAQYLTTNASVVSPTSCVATGSLLSLQWPVAGTNNTAVVSYAVVTTGTHSVLHRYYCQGLFPPSTRVVNSNVQSSLTATVTGSSCSQFACTPAATAASSGWASAVGVSGVTLQVVAPEKTPSGTTTFSYSLTGVPRVSNNVSRGGTIAGHAPLLMLGSGSPAVSCTGHDSITVNGTASIDSTGTAIQTNGNASFSATTIAVGNPSASGAFSGGNISPSTPTQTGVTTADPFIGLPPPVVEPIPGTVTAGSTYDGLPVFGDSNLQADGPGIYLNAVSINSAMTISSGTYVFQNGLSLSGNGALTGSGGAPVPVLFYVYRGAVSLNGNGAIALSPLPSQTAGAGLTLWVDQGDTSSVSLGGNGSAIVISGTVYAPSLQVGVGGNGSLNLGSLVASSVSCQGGGSAGAIVINYGGA
ncbi:MAG TPA: prepilin-type N-terminal cleavage/methylation domain-containing protein [Acidimicrobiales bacterium]|nr:prepilin-type N-terminal cleavage/methylation domain-containing protein [Acidimicrobiales bacterium]